MATGFGCINRHVCGRHKISWGHGMIHHMEPSEILKIQVKAKIGFKASRRRCKLETGEDLANRPR